MYVHIHKKDIIIFLTKHKKDIIVRIYKVYLMVYLIIKQEMRKRDRCVISTTKFTNDCRHFI